MARKQIVVIIGAGPAGLTAAYELMERSKKYEVMVLEETEMVGGISRTVNYKGNRMDMGGHRFFSKVSEVNEWWEKMLPMLKRKRLSRIFFNRKFFDYPISLKISTIKNMGFGTTFVVGCSYLKSAVFKRREQSLEDFFINRFGKKLYSMFFEDYTENLWGRHPRDISPEWGAQRVKGLSISAILKDIFGKTIKKKNRKVETSLIEEFAYPKYGPGQLWEKVAREVEKKGGKIMLGAKVFGIKRDKTNKVVGVLYEKDGKKKEMRCDFAISTMPMKDLVAAMDDAPKKPAQIAEGLPYRDFITIGVLVPKLALKNISDNWIYINNRDVKLGRIQFFNNWSPYMVKDSKHRVWAGLEYFCNEGDELWRMPDDDFAKMAIGEAVDIGIFKQASDVLDYHVERVKKAYPAYFDTYSETDELRKYLDKIPNLYLIGRNGQHRYNNMDHSMLTAFRAVDNIISGREDKGRVWNVNTEAEYHEK